MTAVPRRFLLSIVPAFVLVAVLALGCGPTAEALHPTLPMRSANPAPGDGQPLGTPSGTKQPIEPAASHTPPPPGIAQPMTGFSQGDAYALTDVTATPNGFVAVGYVLTSSESFGADQGVVWTSSDGMTWQESEDAAFIDVRLDGVTSAGSDVYVFGFYQGGGCSGVQEEQCTDDPNVGTVIFRSSSGGPWQQLAQTQAIVQADIEGMTGWGSKVVAWGYDGEEGVSTIWTSTDGLNWTPTSNLAGADSIDEVTAGGPGLVALGEKYVEDIEDYQFVAWSSSDGLTFNPSTVPTVTGTEIKGATAGSNGIVGVGTAVSDTAPSLALAVFSVDGSTWAAGTPSDNSFEDGDVEGVHALSSGYVAVGSTVGQDDFDLLTGRLWLSADGQSWRSIGDFGGSFSELPASALGPNGLVAFTSATDELSDEGVDIAPTRIYGWFFPTSQLTP